MIDTYNEVPEPLDKECAFCGESCDEEFCSKDCKKAYIND